MSIQLRYVSKLSPERHINSSEETYIFWPGRSRSGPVSTVLVNNALLNQKAIDGHVFVNKRASRDIVMNGEILIACLSICFVGERRKAFSAGTHFSRAVGDRPRKRRAPVTIYKRSGVERSLNLPSLLELVDTFFFLWLLRNDSGGAIRFFFFFVGKKKTFTKKFFVCVCVCVEIGGW